MNLQQLDFVKVHAPATVANVVCGFDVLGFALHEPGDEVVVRRVDQPGVKLVHVEGDNGQLPRDAEANTVTVSIINFLNKIAPNVGIEVELYKKMPIGSGLGSSAASTVAGVYAANALIGSPLKKIDLLEYALTGEKIACGSSHADNVAPSLLGGFTLIRSYEPLDVISLPYPDELVATVVYPHLEIKTKDARRILKHQITMQNAVIQWGNVAGLVSGLFMKDFGLIGRSMQDVIVEPMRSILIPDFYQIKEEVLAAGALGFGISGSGPSVFALSNSKNIAEKAREIIISSFKEKDIFSDAFISTINKEGVKIIDQA